MRGFWFTTAVACLAYWILLGQLHRSQFGSIVVLFGVLFFIYLYLVKNHSSTYKIFIPLVLFNAIAFYFAPNLSDDYWRFLWDGHVIYNGISPYEFTPTQLLEAGKADAWLHEVYRNLNSPNYFSVYPPLNQYLFTLAGTCRTPEAGLIVLKTIVVIGNVLLLFSIDLIRKIWKLSPKTTWLILLNPLLIAETTGNLHFEGITIALFLLGVYFIHQSKLIYAGLFIGMAVSVKLVPLLFLPFLFNHYGWKKNISVIVTAFLLNLVLCIPLLNIETLGKISTSINLYFQTFEFNSFGFGLLNKGTSLLAGFNTIHWIGPLCSITFIIIGVILWVKQKNKPQKNLWLPLTLLLFTFYFLSTTVHPWYIIYPLVIGFLANTFYGLYFSLLVVLSYGFYLYGNSFTLQVITLIEYGTLILLIWKTNFIESKYLSGLISKDTN